MGQIEGGFIQGMGWLTMEEVKWKPNGQLTTYSPSTYKIPAVSDMPEKFYAKIFNQGQNIQNVVNKSKTTGEPPLMLAMSVFFAIKDAISSVSNYKISPILDAPATPEKIYLAINNIKKTFNAISSDKTIWRLHKTLYRFDMKSRYLARCSPINLEVVYLIHYFE